MDKIIKPIIKRKRVKFIFFLLIVICSTLALIVYLRNKQASETIAVNELQNRQLILARAGASSILLFLNSMKYNLRLIGESTAVTSSDNGKTEELFRMFINSYKSNPIIGIYRMDKDGKLAISTEKIEANGSLEIDDVSDRDYFIWSKNPNNKGKVYLSDPVISKTGSNKEKYAIVMSTPVYSSNNFNGIVAIGFPLDEFAISFITPFRIDDKGYSSIIDDKGVIRGSSLGPGLNGENFSFFVKDALKRNEIISELQSKKDEGKMITTADINQKTGVVDYVFAYKKFSLENSTFFLIVINDKKDIEESNWLLRNNQHNLLIVIIIFTLIAGLILVVMDNVSHREGLLKGKIKK